ncbi:MAG: FAD/NAD(P)-binding protein [Spirochaetes bacterium]|nr:FAD/NAD(P)-binding protein [Spirochaetota bacterium]
MKDLYKPIEVKVEQIKNESPGIKSYILKPQKPNTEFSFETGQFIELTLPGFGEAPFTPSSSPFNKKKMEVTVMDAGYVTSRLHKLKKGAKLGVRGPYGVGYPLKEFEGKDIIILGGGVGLAPLRSLLLSLIAEKKKYGKIMLCYGAKTPKDIIYKSQFQAWKRSGVKILRSVDKKDGSWKETTGVVTVLLDKIKINKKNTIAVVCGPPIMMKFGTLKCLKIGVPDRSIYLSMERNMSCGLGKCGHCAFGPYFVCKDGPVFQYSKVKNFPDVWE